MVWINEELFARLGIRICFDDDDGGGNGGAQGPGGGSDPSPSSAPAAASPGSGSTGYSGIGTGDNSPGEGRLGGNAGPGNPGYSGTGTGDNSPGEGSYGSNPGPGNPGYSGTGTGDNSPGEGSYGGNPGPGNPGYSGVGTGDDSPGEGSYGSNPGPGNPGYSGTGTGDNSPGEGSYGGNPGPGNPGYSGVGTGDDSPGEGFEPEGSIESGSTDGGISLSTGQFSLDAIAFRLGITGFDNPEPKPGDAPLGAWSGISSDFGAALAIDACGAIKNIDFDRYAIAKDLGEFLTKTASVTGVARGVIKGIQEYRAGESIEPGVNSAVTSAFGYLGTIGTEFAIGETATTALGAAVVVGEGVEVAAVVAAAALAAPVAAGIVASLFVSAGISYAWGHFFGHSGSGAGSPIVLDLTGHGISITPLTSSNTFETVTTDGYSHRTAWAGAGNAVLFYDPTNSGKISNADQVIFTDWDPTATTDMQALADVFDTNHDGKLDAGDAAYAAFKLMVTNADGTTSVETLAQAGIASLDLTANNVTRTFSDGSTIDGETTFTRTDGSTGTAATVTFAEEAAGTAVQGTTTVNADSSITIDNKALNPDGSLASETVSTTSADGASKTIAFEDGDGLVDHVQTDITVANPDGSTTETLRDVTGAGVLQDRTTTTTAADGSLVTIQRDLTGGGVVEQTETRQTGPDGSVVDTLTNIAADGSTIDRTVTTSSADGLSTTTQVDRTGTGTFDLVTTDVTIVNPDGSRTQTVTDRNADGSLLDQTVLYLRRRGVQRAYQADSTDMIGRRSKDLTFNRCSQIMGGMQLKPRPEASRGTTDRLRPWSEQRMIGFTIWTSRVGLIRCCGVACHGIQADQTQQTSYRTFVGPGGTYVGLNAYPNIPSSGPFTNPYGTTLPLSADSALRT